jgi:hypothetical protein
MVKSIPLHRLSYILGHDSLDTIKWYDLEKRYNVQQAIEIVMWR